MYINKKTIEKYNDIIKDINRVRGWLEVIQREDMISQLTAEKRYKLRLNMVRLSEMLIAFDNVNYKQPPPSYLKEGE